MWSQITNERQLKKQRRRRTSRGTFGTGYLLFLFQGRIQPRAFCLMAQFFNRFCSSVSSCLSVFSRPFSFCVFCWVFLDAIYFMRHFPVTPFTFVRKSRTHPSGSTQQAAAKWFACFFVFRIYNVCSFEEEDFLENLRTLSFIWLKNVLFNFLCVFVANNKDTETHYRKLLHDSALQCITLCIITFCLFHFF